MANEATERRDASREKQRLEEEALREGLFEDARRLLVMIHDEIKTRFNPTEIGCDPFGTSRPFSFDLSEGRKVPVLVIDGVSIPLMISQAKGGSAYHRVDRNHLAVVLDSLWDYRDGIYLARKNFTYSEKTRQATFGFDVPKIASHIMCWLADKAEMDRKIALRERSEEQWGSVHERLVLKFGGNPRSSGTVHGCELTVTTGGLKLSLTADERLAEAILQLVVDRKCESK